MKIRSFIILLLLTTNLYCSKITIWNNTLSPITATIKYSANKTKTIKLEKSSHKSWDNVVYNMRSIQINNKSLKLDKGIRKHFEVFYDGTKIGYGQGIKFITPDSKLKYHEVCFLGAHNAHVSHAYGYGYGQQDKKIADQFKYGVRTFLLDTYPANKKDLTKSAQPTDEDSIDDFEVMLWHGPTGKDLKMKFADTLITIKELLKNNPQEIVTLQLENHARGKLIDHVIEQAKIDNFILQPKDWDPRNKDGWPRLKWMIEKNKRLVIFNSQYTTDYTYDQWDQITENQYGELDIKKAAKLRPQKQRPHHKHHLFSLNYFGTIASPVNYPSTNSTKLRELIKYIYKNGLEGKFKKRYPNFIALDYVSRGKNGDPLKLINEINHKSKINKNRASTIFRPLEP